MRRYEPVHDPDKEPDEFEINRLILIGNGFDRAHGMKTAYADFIRWYILSMLSRSGSTDDVLMTVTRNETISVPAGFDQLSLKEMLSQCNYEQGANLALKNFKREFHELTNYAPYRFYIKSAFLHHLLMHCCDEDWVDIENEYYQALKSCLPQSHSYKSPPVREKEVEDLNKTLSHLTEKLHQYLRSLPLPLPNNKFNKFFFEKLKQEDFIHDIQNTVINLTLIVNFNYTHTVEEYFKEGVKENEIDIIHIHGEIDHPQNPLIFGFGDELDDDYKVLENEKVKGFLDKMKSFGYFRNDNYRKLVRFIEAKEFQVFVIGHSCGLSDRTMLNMIFEHPNCWSIKVFHHAKEDGTNNYRELTQEISRHFSHKQEMRKRIVSFNEDNRIPQN